MTFWIGFLNLWRHPRRTLTVITTVALGTGSLFLFHGFNNGMMNQYREGTIRSHYGNGQVNTAGYRDQVFEKPWEHWIDSAPDLERALRGLEGVTHVFPRIEFFSLLNNGEITISGRGQGVRGSEEADFFNALNIVEGKTLATQADGLILGLGLARTLNAKVGDRVTALTNTVRGSLNGLDFEVAGIFHTGRKEFDDVYFRVQLNRAQTLLDTTKVETVSLGLKDVTYWPSVAKMVEAQFPNLDAIPFQDLDKVYYQHSVDWLDSQFGFIQGIILFVVILGIFNTVSTAVMERKQEIGNLRANGESIWSVLRLFLSEGFFMGAIGAVFGVVITGLFTFVFLREGLLMPPAPGLTRQFRVLIELASDQALKSFFLGTFSCLAATLTAAYFVVKKPIGELLRSV